MRRHVVLLTSPAAEIFFAFGLPARHAVTCEPNQAAWGRARRALSATESPGIRLLVRMDGESKPN